ncbi:adult-specific cuticular protein ACP-20-like [Amphibalanus amphitrite]|uniref:adult-specific cuticular protein ACP-20-like n=1 Tax=Amphibalanus amphitrite TaxID=1232801 RepID=UPI001C901698|nr:adult-specific cuticular protein ACP-20-like [Amphibalanus amphitrite]
MKLFVLSALVAVVAAGGYSRPLAGGRLGGQVGALQGSLGHGLGGAYGPGNSLDYYAVPDYNTGYSVKDAYSGVDIDSQENRLGDRTEGSYSTLLPDGRRQIVTYWVDGNSGYNARVTYEGVAHHRQTTPLGYGGSTAGLGSLALGASGGPGYGVGGGVTFGGGSGLGLGGALGSGYRGSGVVYRSAAGRGYGGL